MKQIFLVILLLRGSIVAGELPSNSLELLFLIYDELHQQETQGSNMINGQLLAEQPLEKDFRKETIVKASDTVKCCSDCTIFDCAGIDNTQDYSSCSCIFKPDLIFHVLSNVRGFLGTLADTTLDRVSHLVDFNKQGSTEVAKGE